ncbi:hypothetical protein JOM56_009575 [Amanita muscaria]
MDLDTGFTPDDTDAISNIPPPGDKGFDLSHEGGEYEVFEGLAEDIARSEDVFHNETLIRHGFLGCSPLEPSLAISIQMLEAYRSPTRHAQCKTLCHMYNIPYRPTLRTQFSIAFDAYLQILRHINRKIDLALEFDTPASRICRSCPACFYKLQGEPDLEFSVLFCMDGNNSLKRLGSIIRNCNPRLDSRTLDSDQWIPAEEVDAFKDEVRWKQKANEELEGPDKDDWEDIPNSEPGPLNCIFIACCRHKMVLAACDMIKSGELSKYPLAVVNRLISLAGAKIGCAYDIGCVFETTLASVTVAAGTGHSEGDGCEHVFSSSNDLARTTRHATRFHRHQAIEEHFKFWDEDKYANLSQFLVNHYRAAPDAIKTLEAELYVLQNQLSVSPDDFTMYIEQEKSYLQGLEQPSPAVSRKIRYIQALNDQSQLVLQAKIQHAEEYVGTLEAELNIREHWTESTPEYKEFYQQNVLTQYSWALDELERLVVMRLFELAKMSLSGTGYKLRCQISKALQHRSEAIRKALNQYNTQAARLIPPRPPLSWKDIVDYTFIAEFDLLRHSRADVHSELWAQPARREAALKFFKLCQAKEELTRLNIEIKRLRTWTYDESEHIATTINRLSTTDPLLSLEIQRRWSLCASINNLHLQ